MAERAAHRLLLEVEVLRRELITSMSALARALTERGVPTSRFGKVWTHTTVGRLLTRTAMQRTCLAPGERPLALLG
jgi:Recombinase